VLVLVSSCAYYIITRWHRNGMPLPITSAEFKDMDSINSVLTEDEKAHFNPVPSGLKRGEASFHHPMMVHGSYANRYGLYGHIPVVSFPCLQKRA